MLPRALFVGLLGAALGLTASAQNPGLPAVQPPSGYKIIPFTPPTLSPGVMHLLDLETRFAADVAKGGGKAFATWFAEDAVTLNNGQPVVVGRGAIAAAANWTPEQYSLSWAVEGAQMGPSNDMGFTWGHYEGRTIPPPGGQPVVTTGRYITVWRKLPGNVWKVAMDASADEPKAPPQP